MMELLRLDLGSGAEVCLDAVDVTPEGAAVPAGTRKPIPIGEAVEKLEGAVGVISKSGKGLVQTFREMETDQVTLKMGIGFTTEGNVFIAKAGASVNFEVTFTWKSPQTQSLPER